MKKIIGIIIAALMCFALSGCHESYPYVLINEGFFSDTRKIDIGKPYKYQEFRLEKEDDGTLNVIISFKNESVSPSEKVIVK